MGLGNSTTGTMTREELDIIRTSWGNLMKNPEQNGILIFRRFMEKYKYYSYFKKFEGIPEQEFLCSPAFRKHAVILIQALNSIILRIGSDSLTKADLIALGKMHGKKNITEQQFQEMKGVFVDTLANEFNSAGNCLLAWNKLIDIAYLYVFEGLTMDK